jgi:hypothetical protein
VGIKGTGREASWNRESLPPSGNESRSRLEPGHFATYWRYAPTTREPRRLASRRDANPLPTSPRPRLPERRPGPYARLRRSPAARARGWPRSGHRSAARIRWRSGRGARRPRAVGVEHVDDDQSGVAVAGIVAPACAHGPEYAHVFVLQAGVSTRVRRALQELLARTSQGKATLKKRSKGGLDPHGYSNPGAAQVGRAEGSGHPQAQGSESQPIGPEGCRDPCSCGVERASVAGDSRPGGGSEGR